MQTTDKELKIKSDKAVANKEEKTHSSVFGQRSEVPAIQPPSIQLSKDLAGSLMDLIRDVNKSGITPETVNASCNAAAQIYKILRLNFEMKKEGF